MSTLRKWAARFLQLFAPGFGCCYRCGMPWKFAKQHTTYLEERNGCFALCNKCWQELTPAERLPFYRKLLETWIDSEREARVIAARNGVSAEMQWPLIEKAVLEGK